ncbi:hypothetical protein BD410DRAFT_809018 [Rickenella mellea]|uniref:Uncharacterized protein n=1 Tax=Rickenella mellea TaxID=50990 RepID=A0A4Y7PIK9_9AGAM|nr:hypothetical protein BD410DRAFT_809018 [Rickenella mellea]
MPRRSNASFDSDCLPWDAGGKLEVMVKRSCCEEGKLFTQVLLSTDVPERIERHTMLLYVQYNILTHPFMMTSSSGAGGPSENICIRLRSSPTRSLPIFDREEETVDSAKAFRHEVLVWYTSTMASEVFLTLHTIFAGAITSVRSQEEDCVGLTHANTLVLNHS